MVKRLLIGSRIVVPLGYILVFLGVLLIWQLSSTSFLVPSVKETVSFLLREISNGSILFYARNTFESVFIAFGLSVAFGLLIGVTLGLAQYWRDVLEPIVLGGYSIPKIILFPIFITFLGIGKKFTVFMGLIHGLFPMIINVTAGIKEINPIYLKVGKCYQCSALQFLKKIYLPAIALPFIIGVRLAFSLCILGVVIVEILIKTDGLGSHIMTAYYMQDLPTMFSYIIFLYGVAFVGNIFFWAIERRLQGKR